MDWGLRSPLYPAAAQAAVQAAARALQASGVLPAGDSVEWVWHDSACDAQKVGAGGQQADASFFSTFLLLRLKHRSVEELAAFFP